MNQQRETLQSLGINAAQAAERQQNKEFTVRDLLQRLQAEINASHSLLTSLEEMCACITSPKDTNVQSCVADSPPGYRYSAIVHSLLEAIAEQERLKKRIYLLIDALEI